MIEFKKKLGWIFRKWGVEWIELAQERDSWQAI
jgi:hypothetical protein